MNAVGCEHRRPQKFFQGEKHRHFTHFFQNAEDAMQIEVNKTLYPFYAPKIMFMGVGRGDGRTKIPLDVEMGHFPITILAKRLIFQFRVGKTKFHHFHHWKNLFGYPWKKFHNWPHVEKILPTPVLRQKVQ